ncbi:MAG: hypothetical protein PHZ09_08270 [Eubacteriales bacterium]|nr:hypothetical protein [Eubacteriales bacterium]
MKNIRIFITFSLIIIIMQLVGCQKDDSRIPQTNDGNTDYYLRNYAYDELYKDGVFDEDMSTPAYKRTKVYPTKNTVYSFFASWKRSYINENRTISTYPLCRDPLCSHTKLPCISYAALTSDSVIEANGKLYLLISGDDEKKNKFIEYDTSSGKYTVIGEFVNGGQLIARLGRFVYFYVIRIDGHTDSGMQLSTLLLHRYDIAEKSLEKIGERNSKESFLQAAGHAGYIYYIDVYYNLCRCDVNFQNVVELVSNKNVITYEVIYDKIFYLTKESGNDYGILYSLDIDNKISEELYDEVTWFCIYNNKLYYSKYSPVEAFDWDFPQTGEDGKRVIKNKMIIIMNGNTIYSIDLDKAGKKVGNPLPMCEKLTEEGCYLGETFAVYDGYVFTHLKESYSDGAKKGMLTGVTAISIADGQINRLESEYVIFS